MFLLHLVTSMIGLFMLVLVKFMIYLFRNLIGQLPNYSTDNTIHHHKQSDSTTKIVINSKPSIQDKIQLHRVPWEFQKETLLVYVLVGHFFMIEMAFILVLICLRFSKACSWVYKRLLIVTCLGNWVGLVDQTCSLREESTMAAKCILLAPAGAWNLSCIDALGQLN